MLFYHFRPGDPNATHIVGPDSPAGSVPDVTAPATEAQACTPVGRRLLR